MDNNQATVSDQIEIWYVKHTLGFSSNKHGYLQINDAAISMIDMAGSPIFSVSAQDIKDIAALTNKIKLITSKGTYTLAIYDASKYKKRDQNNTNPGAPMGEDTLEKFSQLQNLLTSHFYRVNNFYR